MSVAAKQHWFELAIVKGLGHESTSGSMVAYRMSTRLRSSKTRQAAQGPEKDNPQCAFDEIVRAYFPRWWAGRSWRCRWTNRKLGPCDGQCDTDRGIVYVSRINSLLFIHEICHAFSTGHGRLWQRRMEAAAKRADELGHSELAQEIRDEVALYGDGSSIGRAELYSMVRDTVGESSDWTPSFRDVVRYVSREAGMTQAEFVREFPRARKFYDKGKRDKQAWKSAKRRFAAKKILIRDRFR